MFKLIFTLGGYFFLGLPGLVVGFIVGSLIDRISGGGARVQTIINDRRQVSPADFELNLLSLCSIVIKADGTVNQNELHYVRNYRSEERRVGKECRSRRLLSHEKK